jgi:hypothetical protein
LLELATEGTTAAVAEGTWEGGFDIEIGPVDENGALPGFIWYCPGMLGGADAAGNGLWCLGDGTVDAVAVMFTCC